MEPIQNLHPITQATGLNHKKQKKTYQAPAFSVLSADQAKAKLVSMAKAGNSDAEEMLRAISEGSLKSGS